MRLKKLEKAIESLQPTINDLSLGIGLWDGVLDANHLYSIAKYNDLQNEYVDKTGKVYIPSCVRKELLYRPRDTLSDIETLKIINHGTKRDYT